jgi:Holliday junction resolvase
VKNSVTEGQIISPTINNSTIEIKKSVKTPVKVVKEDVNKTVVYVTKKSYTSIVSELLCSLISFATPLDVLHIYCE